MVGIITSHSGLRPDAKRYVMAGRGLVVDAGGRGDYTTIQDAVDYYDARPEAGRIYIREGTYRENVTCPVKNITVEGASWDTVIDGEAAVAFTPSVNWVTLKNLSVKTTAGGGAEVAAIVSASTATFFKMIEVQIAESDENGANLSGQAAMVRSCYVTNCDVHGLDFQSVAAFCTVVGNYINAGSGNVGLVLRNDCFAVNGNIVLDPDSIQIASGGDNGVVDGNAINAAVTDNGSGNVVSDNVVF